MKCRCLVVMALGLVMTFAFVMVGNTQEAPGKAKFSPTIEAKNVVSLPMQVKFIRPGAVKKTNFAPVSFSHGQHMNVSCTTCHHTWDGASEVQACATEGCHGNFVNRAETDSYYKAFHSRTAENSCLGCHTALNKNAAKKVKISPCSNNACHVAK